MSYLNERNQVCKLERSLSSERLVECGVPQGSNLDPLLFLISINHLPNCLKYSTPALFADDTNVTVSGVTAQEIDTKLNEELENLNCWLLANKLKMNANKSEDVLIGSRQRLSHIEEQPYIYVNNQTIKYVNRAKILNVFVDKNLAWKAHIKHICKRFLADQVLKEYTEH